MNLVQSTHAQHVVDAFKKILSEEAREHISAEELDELAMLIESAIDSAMVGKLNAATDIAKKAAADITKLARNE